MIEPIIVTQHKEAWVENAPEESEVSLSLLMKSDPSFISVHGRDIYIGDNTVYEIQDYDPDAMTFRVQLIRFWPHTSSA